MVENDINIVKQQLNRIKSTLFTRGFENHKMVEVLLLFIFLRRMECLFAPVNSKVQKIYNDYKEDLDYDDMDKKIRKVIGDLRFYTTSPDMMENLLKKGYLDTVAGFEHYFKTFDHETLESLEQFGAYTILGELSYRKQLVYVTDSFCKIDLGDLIDDNEFLELVNELLREKTQGGKYGIYTSWDFSSIMYMLATGGDFTKVTPSVYDPVCGSAKLLRDVAIRFATTDSTAEIYGQDIMSPSVGMANLIANSFEHSHQHYVSGDTLLEDKFPDKKFDYIVADLPVNMPWNSDLAWQGKDRFMAFPAKDDSTLLFVQHIVNKMKENGRAAFTCVPRIFTATDSGSESIRAWLLEKDLIETIVILPSGFMSWTNIPFCICVLANNKSEDRKGKVQIIDCKKIWTKKSGGRVLVDNAAQNQLWNAYTAKEGLVDKDAFFSYKLNVCQPVRTKSGELQMKDGEKVADKKKTLSVTIPATEKDIIGYVRKNYLNHADPDAWVDVTSISRVCSIDLIRLTASVEEAPSLDAVEASATEIKSQIEFLLDDIFAPDQVSIASEPLPTQKKTCMLNALVRIVRQSVIKDEVKVVEGECPILSAMYLRGDKDVDSLDYPTEPDKYQKVNDGDTIIVMSGAYAGEVLLGKNGFLPRHLAKLELISDSVSKEYLYFLLKAKESEIMGSAYGAAMKTISAKSLSSLAVEIPSLEEQYKVVNILSAKIESIDKLLPMLGGKAKQTMQEYRQALIVDAVLGCK